MPYDADKIESLLSPRSLQAFLRARDMRARHGMGQNFLVSRQILTRIAESAKIVPGETLLEIGPGLGFLTHYLLAAGARVIGCEMDLPLADWLDEVFAKEERFTLMRGDFLQTDLSALFGVQYIPPPFVPFRGLRAPSSVMGEGGTPLPHHSGSFRAVANLPYNITSPALERLFSMGPSSASAEGQSPVPVLTEIIVMVQRQVAERIIAKPGTRAYGSLTLFALFYSEPELLFHVSPGHFHPAPSVYSSVVRFTLHAPVLEKEAHPHFFALVRAVFSSRRKVLRNSLRESPFTRMSDGILQEVLKACALDGGIRGETLDFARFADMARAWRRHAGEAACPPVLGKLHDGVFFQEKCSDSSGREKLHKEISILEYHSASERHKKSHEEISCDPSSASSCGSEILPQVISSADGVKQNNAKPNTEESSPPESSGKGES